ncbi:Protein PBN1 [Escovopsis weberi]|uniref:Protein PBN1 n=1 Tax=Escovopsis weberi TaxID=150374 RepID=A0A0M9VU85_ESCWE|nr:Protein PBN1 [Escovopsis weberi]
MRERITFLYPEGGAVDPKSLTLGDTALQGPTIEAIREDKFTLTLQELPSEVAKALEGIDELHLRWTGPWSQPALEPFSSRLSPGLHLSYTPSAGAGPDPFAFGPLDCASPEFFTDLREGRHGDTAAFYFYQEVEDLQSFARKASDLICAAADDTTCQERAEGLGSAAGLDASYESAAGTVKVGASWPLRRRDISAAASPHRRTEVGILGRDAPPGIKAHEVGISGLLTVVGDSKEPSVTLFSFPSRHRLAQGSFSADFLAPTGLHPAMRLSVSSTRPGDEAGACKLYAYLTLPKVMFADRYQLADELFLASKNLSAAPYVSRPVDLEAPAYATKAWGSNVLVELLARPEPAGEHEAARTAEMPLHLRYLKPSQTGMADAEIPYPVVFWACEPAAADVDLGNNPFDRLHLGYDGLFSRDTVFWHVAPRPETGDRLLNRVAIPVLADQASQWIGVGTAAVVGLGFIWVLMRLAGASGRGRERGSVDAKPEQGRKQKKQK